jgi:glutamate--cysteine ligase
MHAVGCAGTLIGGKRGLEKESLRVTRDGRLAGSPHPRAWGSALTHPYITTDYSEALSEFITPAFSKNQEVADFLQHIHQFIYQELSPEELLWCASMPCAIKDDQEVPIAEFGHSNIGRMKHVYRVGLDYRYGRRMQAIAGVHFNYSLPSEFWPQYQALEKDPESQRTFIDKSYFALIRNFRRLGWLVPLLFGTSPVVGSSFLAGRTARFKAFDAHSHYLPHATSLRMSDIGYKNKNQAVLQMSYDNLDNYVASLTKAIATPYPEYEVIGLYDGEQRVQLNTNVLQLENEFYSYMRPKRTTRSGEKPTAALRARGVEYVEMRALDVFAFSPSGVSLSHMHFLEAFLVLCLIAESPAIEPEEQWAIEYNELTIALRGREPGLRLIQRGKRVAVTDWATEIFNAMEGICEILDSAEAGTPYRDALNDQRATLQEPTLLPSAQMLQRLRAAHQSFHEFALALSNEHAAHFRAHPPSESVAQQFESIAEESLGAQRTLEADESMSFEDYLARYFAG